MSILQANGAGLGGAGDPGGALASSSIYGTTIDQSLRLDGSTAYLSKNDFGTATDTSKRTFSTWVKSSKDSFSSNNYIISASSSNIDAFGFNTSEGLQWLQGGVNTYNGDRLLRDVGAWYHFFTTWNATDNEVYLYVNGELDKSFTSSISPLSKMCQSGQLTTIGKRSNSGTYIHGYLAETVFLDGTIGDINDFGELVNGIWVPKDISAASLTYGTNGFYLDYADSSDLGKDVSGKSNHFTSNSLAAEDQVPDSPTSNWATMNPLYKGVGITYYEGNLKLSASSGFSTTAYGSQSTIAIPKDKKVYIEIEETVAIGNTWAAGIATASDKPNSTTVSGPSSITVYNRQVYVNGVENDYGASAGLGGLGSARLQAGDILGIAVDGSTGEVWFAQNNSWFKTPTTDDSGTVGDPSAGTNPIGTISNPNDEDLFLVVSGNGASNIWVNFGQDSTNVASAESDANGLGTFEYAPPTDYVCLAASSLSEPTIGPNSAEQADDYFNTLLYTGDGATSRSITGVGFAPDFVWGKCRSNAEDNILSDTVRGANKKLESNNTDAENTSTAATLSGFESDGFTGPSSTPGNINVSGRTYVAWNWKAGGTAVSNTDGSITSQVSAAPDAGFSIVGYTGTGANATVGHGLSSAPEMLIIKNRDSSLNWPVGHKDISGGFGGYIQLDLTNSQTTSVGVIFNSTAPTSSVFSIGSNNQVNNSGDDHIAYCFHSVPGYQAVGKYVGNGSTDGPFVYTGFRPAWFIIKRTDSANNWQIHDTIRNPINPMDDFLRANTNDAEIGPSTSYHFDVLSNGFKIRNTSGAWNTSGGTYIYLAFAEAPFKYANAR